MVRVHLSTQMFLLFFKYYSIFCPCRLTDKPRRYGRLIGGSNPSEGTVLTIKKNCVIIILLVMEMWLSGLKRTTANRVGVTPSRVRIPPSPQVSLTLSQKFVKLIFER